MTKTGLQKGPSHSYPWLSRSAKYMLEATNGVQTRFMLGKQLEATSRARCDITEGSSWTDI